MRPRAQTKRGRNARASGGSPAFALASQGLRACAKSQAGSHTRRASPAVEPRPSLAKAKASWRARSHCRPKAQSQSPIPKPNLKAQSQSPISKPNLKAQSQSPIPKPNRPLRANLFDGFRSGPWAQQVIRRSGASLRRVRDTLLPFRDSNGFDFMRATFRARASDSGPRDLAC